MAEVLTRILVCDRVKVIDPASPYYGQSGEVVDRVGMNHAVVVVRFDEAMHGKHTVSLSALEKEEA